MGLSVGQIVSGTLAMVGKRFAPLLGLWFVYVVLTIVATFVFGMVIGLGGMAAFSQVDMAAQDGSGLGALGALGGGMIGGIILFYLGYILISMAQMGSLVAKATPLEEQSFGDALFAGMRSAPTLLGVIIVLGIGYLVGALLLGMVMALLASAGTVVSVVSIVLVLALLLWLASRLMLIFPVAVVERRMNPFAVIGRSWSMTSGKVLPILLSLVILLLVFCALVALLVVPVIGVFGGGQVPGGGIIAYIFIGIIVLTAVFSMLQAALVAVIHAEVSGRTGVDLDATFG